MDYWKSAESLSEEEKRCPACGTPVEADKKYCFHCGCKLEGPPPEPYQPGISPWGLPIAPAPGVENTESAPAAMPETPEPDTRDPFFRLWDEGNGVTVSMQHVDGRIGDKPVGIFEEIRVFPKERLAINKGQSTLDPAPKFSAKQIPEDVTSVEALMRWLTHCGWPVCFRTLDETEKQTLHAALGGNTESEVPTLVMSGRKKTPPMETPAEDAPPAPVGEVPPAAIPVKKAPPVTVTTPPQTVPKTPPQTAPAAEADPGLFFQEAKKRIKTGYIKNILLSVFLTFLFGTIIAVTGFSPEMEWQIGLRYSDLGIPLPNWLISTVALLFGIVAIAFLVMSIKGFFACQEYDSLLAAAKTFGNVQAVGQHLQKLSQNTLAKKSGQLRFDKDIFFYQKGEEVWLFPTRNISNIKPVQKSHGSSSDYYVEITYAGKRIEIPTKKKNTLPLANEILAVVKQAATR